MAGCNYKCLNCQNWTISQYPDNGFNQRGYEDPEELARECVKELGTLPAQLMRADRIFFSGGEPTIHLPYIHKVVEEARQMNRGTRINFDTNGFMTERSLERILGFTTSITYDLKAYHDEVHLALTGAPSKPVLRNAEQIGRHAKDKLWEYRITVIPKINEDEVKPLVEFIANIDPTLPVCFLAFRPNFVLEEHPGAGRGLMDRCAEIAKRSGLTNVSWSGHVGLPGAVMSIESEMKENYASQAAQLAASYAFHARCQTHPRACSTCTSNQACEVKTYVPKIAT